MLDRITTDEGAHSVWRNEGSMHRILFDQLSTEPMTKMGHQLPSQSIPQLPSPKIPQLPSRKIPLLPSEKIAMIRAAPKSTKPSPFPVQRNGVPAQMSPPSRDLNSHRLMMSQPPASARAPQSQIVAKPVQRSLSQHRKECSKTREAGAKKEASPKKEVKKEMEGKTGTKMDSSGKKESAGHRSGEHLKHKSVKEDKFVHSYHGLDVTQRLKTPLQQRQPRRRAAVIGVNYVFAPDILLRGCCNDATVVALELINLCDFKPEDVILLIDSFPSMCYRSPNFEEREDEKAEGTVFWKDRQPTRRNILLYGIRYNLF